MTVEALRNTPRAPNFWDSLSTAATWVRSSITAELVKSSWVPALWGAAIVWVLARLFPPLGWMFSVAFTVAPWIPVLLLTTAAGLLVVERHAAERDGTAAPSTWLFTRRLLLLDLIGMLMFVLLWGNGTSLWLLGAVCAVGLAIVMRARLEPVGRVAPDPLRRNSTISAAMVTAGIYKPGVSPTLTFRGAPQVDEHGSTRHIGLDGRSWRDVLARHSQLAAAFKIAENRLSVTHDDHDPADVVTLRVGRATTVTAAPIVSAYARATRTNWHDPVRLGTDTATREPISLGTNEENDLIGGKPGAGKTSNVFKVLAHYLLDPTTDVYGLDGKGSRADYGPVRPLCKQWIWGTDENAPTELATMLATVLGVVRERNATEPADVPLDADGQPNWPGVLLLLEEFQDVRAGADKATGEVLDVALGRIIRMGRAVAVKVVVSTQRPSVADVPAGVRNLITQNLALMTRNPEDAKLTLGTTPTLPLPTRRGEGLLATPAGIRAVLLDLMTRSDMAAVCERATALRTTADTAPSPAPAVAPAVASVATLASSVYAALADGPLPATDLLERIPAHLRPSTVVSLGKLLASDSRLERPYVAQRRVWRLRLAPAVAPAVKQPLPAVLPAAPQVLEADSRSDGDSVSHLPYLRCLP